MKRPSCLFDLTGETVADASIIINLSATGHYETIIDALPSRVVVVDAVEQELEYGRTRGRTDAEVLSSMKVTGRVSIVGLDGQALEQFRALVEGPAAETLDDGEAATIAYGAENGAAALIDERKANKICEQRFPALPRGATVDLLTHPAVINALGAARHREALFNALYYGKMRVLPHHEQWVLDVLGKEIISQCDSLPRRLRAAS